MTTSDISTSPDCLAWKPIRLRAPQTDGATLVSPPLEETAGILSENRELFATSKIRLSNRSLKTVRQKARAEAIAAATVYTRSLQDDKNSTAETNTFFEQMAKRSVNAPLIMTGHQPALYHPGVWLKNFVANKIANDASGIALNLIVDNDTVKQSTIAVPTGTLSSPELTHVSIGVNAIHSPWEECQIDDWEQFATFPEKVTQLMKAWSIQPLLAKAWKQTPFASQHGASQYGAKHGAVKKEDAGKGEQPTLADRLTSLSLVDRLTSLRKTTEHQWGIQNLELPISQMCQLPSFFCFAHHILSDLESFVHTHNRILNEYRVVNKIQSQSHPVPELKTKGDWLESPFWIWKSGDTTRRPLYARSSNQQIELSDGIDSVGIIPLECNTSCQTVLDAYTSLKKQGWKIRTRALTTTLFTRLLLCDLFVHGIGGAKYDEMADQILCQFFGIDPPHFVIATGTQHLPLGQSCEATINRVQLLKQKLRDIQVNPARHLSGKACENSDVRSLLDSREKLVQETVERNRKGSKKQRKVRAITNRQRHVAIRNIDKQLSVWTADQRREWDALIVQHATALRNAKLINSRERSFCLFPEEKLKAFFESI